MTPYLTPEDEREAGACWRFSQGLMKRKTKHAQRVHRTRGPVLTTASDLLMVPIVNAFFDIKGCAPVNSCQGHAPDEASFLWLWCDEELTKQLMCGSEAFIRRVENNVFDVSERVSFLPERGVRRTIQFRTWGAVGHHEGYQRGWDTIITWVVNLAWARSQ